MNTESQETQSLELYVPSPADLRIEHYTLFWPIIAYFNEYIGFKKWWILNTAFVFDIVTRYSVWYCYALKCSDFYRFFILKLKLMLKCIVTLEVIIRLKIVLWDQGLLDYK